MLLYNGGITLKKKYTYIHTHIFLRTASLDLWQVIDKSIVFLMLLQRHGSYSLISILSVLFYIQSTSITLNLLHDVSTFRTLLHRSAIWGRGVGGTPHHDEWMNQSRGNEIATFKHQVNQKWRGNLYVCHLNIELFKFLIFDFLLPQSSRWTLNIVVVSTQSNHNK